MKTPEEIKDGMEWCSGNACSDDCPYYHTAPECSANMCRDALAYIQQLESQVPKWISVMERLPEDGTHVLAAVKFNGICSSGGYVCDAFHANKFTITSEFADELACEYCEEKDEYFLEEGWYEVIKNWDDYASVVIADKVTHWMPLPEPPEEDEDEEP